MCHKHKCPKVLSNSPEEWQSYSADTKNRHLFLPLTSKCDLDLGATDLDFTRNTSSHCGKHFYQVILKSTTEWQSYRVDMKMSDRHTDGLFDYYKYPKCQVTYSID